MKKNLFKLVFLAATLATAVSCTKQDEPFITDDNQQATEEGIVRAAAPKIDYITYNFDGSSRLRNVLTCDKYGNAYYVSRENHLYPREVKKVDGSSLKSSVMLSESQIPNNSTGMGVIGDIGIAVDGNGDIYLASGGKILKYNTSGTSADVDFTPILLSKSSSNTFLFYGGITADINDNIYVYNEPNVAANYEDKELFRITKAGAVQLLSSNEPFHIWNGGIFKGRGANIFGTSLADQYDGSYMHMYSNKTPTVVKNAPVSFHGIGAGMDNGYLYVLKGHTIQRVNPNNGAVKQIATLPTELELMVALAKLGTPTHIAPTPDATAFYVAYDSGYLIKVTL